MEAAALLVGMLVSVAALSWRLHVADVPYAYASLGPILATGCWVQGFIKWGAAGASAVVIAAVVALLAATNGKPERIFDQRWRGAKEDRERLRSDQHKVMAWFVAYALLIGIAAVALGML